MPIDNNTEWDDPIFESGRQHVLTSLKNTFEGRLKFLESILNETENITYSIDFRKGVIHCYKEILDQLKLLNGWQKDRNLMASE